MKKHKKEILDELREVAPSFAKMEKKEGFQVPEDYFSELPDKILTELNLSENTTKTDATPPASTAWWTQLIDSIMILMQPRLALGFAVVLVLLVSVFLLTQGSENTSMSLVLSPEEAGQYIMENIDDFDEEMLFDALAEIEGEMNLMDLKEMNFEEAELDGLMEEIIDDLDDNTLEELL